MQLSNKTNIFSQFFWHFQNWDSILNIFKKKMTLIAEVFLNLRTPKKVVRSISKKSCFRGSFEKWHGKQTDKLLKSEREHLYHIYRSLWKQFSWKNSVLVICKILGLFVNPLTADDKDSLLNRSNLLQHVQVQLSQKRNIFLTFFFHFPNLYLILNIFKNRWRSYLMYFWTYGLRKTWLDKCLKSPVSEDPSTSNMVNGQKHCWNVEDSTFAIFIDPCAGKNLRTVC